MTPEHRKLSSMHERGKYVIVLNRNYLLMLDQPGALIRILQARILDVEAVADVALTQHDNMHGKPNCEFRSLMVFLITI